MEKTALVLDASVIVKWFTKEEKREEAIEIRDRFILGEIEIFVPDLVLYEISNALRYNPNFNKEDINLAIDSLLNMELNIIVPTEEIIKKSRKCYFIMRLIRLAIFHKILLQSILLSKAHLLLF